MKNAWKEPIPENINQLLEQSHQITSVLRNRLQNEDCPTLSDLYYKTTKVFRNTVQFKSLGYVPKNKQTDNPNNKNEYKGIYVFAEEVNGVITPVYVGVSRTIYRRLRQQGYGKKHNECTLAYNLAKLKLKNHFSLERKHINQNLLEAEQSVIKNYKVALYEVKYDFDLYFHEVAIASILKTKYNSFKTH